MDTFKKNEISKRIVAANDVVRTLNTTSDTTVRLIISEKNWLESSAVDQLKKTAQLPGMCCGVGMPDLHPGKGQPIGAVFVTRNCIYPHLVGSDIGCGMGLWKLDVTRRQVKLDKWEKRLTNLDDSWKEGDISEWLNEFDVKSNNDLFREDNQKLGTIGGGNHFAEIQQVHEIFDEKTLFNIDLDKQSIVFLAHSGSRGLGQKILRHHIDRYGTNCLKVDDNRFGIGNMSVMTRYIEHHNNAVQWAIANRSLITHRFCERLSVKKKAILDVTHNTVTALKPEFVEALRLENTDNDCYWIHRKGASPTDQGLVVIPGSRGSLSYLVKPKSLSISSLAAGGFSLAHGAGRKWKRSESRGRLENGYKVKDLEVTGLGSRVICKQRDLLYEEAPQAYKNISIVIDDLVQAGLIDLVASFKPLLTYKTRKK